MTVGLSALSVCLSVCLSVTISQEPHVSRQNFTKLSVYPDGGRGSVLLCQRCDVVCTSGFVDGVMFSYSASTAE